MPNETTPSPSIRKSLKDLVRGDNLKDILHNWKWILTRSGAGEWTLRTWGYG